MLVVNTASFCGFTPQYQALEALHTRYRSRGLVVLGFPSNDFGAQEPGANKDIAAFCENTFGVKFPMFVKSRVAAGAGTDRNPLFAELARRTGEPARWNFHKYLIARDGQTVVSRASDVDPQSRGFVAEVEKLLGCAVNTLRLYFELTGSNRAGGAPAMSVDITFGNTRAPCATELVRRRAVEPAHEFRAGGRRRGPVGVPGQAGAPPTFVAEPSTHTGCNPRATFLLPPPSLLRPGALRDFLLRHAAARECR